MQTVYSYSTEDEDTKEEELKRRQCRSILFAAGAPLPPFTSPWVCVVVRRMCWRFGLKVAWLSRDRQGCARRRRSGGLGLNWKGNIHFHLSRATHMAVTMPMHAHANHPHVTSCTPEEHMNINWIKSYWANFIWYVNISESSVYAAIANYFGHFCSHISVIIYGGRIQYTHSSWLA